MKKTINISGKIISLEKPLIMGIINITPDSYYKDNRFSATDKNFLEKAAEMIKNGVDIIDIGGYSSRPGAADISSAEEIDRINPAIETLRKNFPDIIISIDTFRALVAKNAIDAGANIINDISAGELDDQMFETVLKLNVPYIMMHMRGNPQNMQTLNLYNDFLFDILTELMAKANYLKKLGLKDVIIDPGFGFSKNLNQNYILLKNLELFSHYNYPILSGISRKSMIYKYLNIEVEETLPATTQLNLFALLKKTNIIRVHDVLEASQTMQLLEKLA
jgi:dihydropteroate synthase